MYLCSATTVGIPLPRGPLKGKRVRIPYSPAAVIPSLVPNHHRKATALRLLFCDMCGKAFGIRKSQKTCRRHYAFRRLRGEALTPVSFQWHLCVFVCPLGAAAVSCGLLPHGLSPFCAAIRQPMRPALPQSPTTPCQKLPSRPALLCHGSRQPFLWSGLTVWRCCAVASPGFLTPCGAWAVRLCAITVGPADSKPSVCVASGRLIRP